MFKTTQEFDSAMYEVLKELCNEKKLSEVAFPEDEDDRNAAILECIDKEYISGVTYGYTQNGKPHFSVSNLRVTYRGLSFMESL